MSPVEDLTLLDFDRSNKGASKQRRDQINAEIATMRELLPLPESSRQRLSQLQIMSLTCVYIRKCNVLHKLFRTKSLETSLPEALDFFQALTGFLLVTTREGKLLYISENVTDFLGHSMVDMKTQGDSLYDIVDKRDHTTVRSQLQQGCNMEDKRSLSDVSFFCRMNMSRTLKRQSGFGDVKVMHVRGHFIGTGATEPGCPVDSQCVFMATCSPLITPDLKENLVQNNTMVFKTVHQLDMTYYEVTKTAEYHLGMSSEELYKKSWYSMLYPEDIHEAKEKHLQLIRSNHEMGCMMTVRMLKADGSVFWVNLVMHVRQASLAQNDEPLIVCINQVIDAQEAFQIKVQGHMLPMFPSRPHEMWGNHFPTVLPSGQEPPSGHWVQKMSPVSIPSYQSNIPSYIGQSGQPSMYSSGMSVLNNCGIDQSHHHDLNSMISSSSLDQTDQLKARLKRKIQGPHSNTCKPTKIPRTNWSVDRSGGGNGFPESDQSLPMMEQYSHAPMTEGHSDFSGQQMIAVPPRYRIGGLMTAKSSHKFYDCQGMVSSMGSMFSSEQVVPDVHLPESYLTPDPSPISSPEPSCMTVKTEVMDSDARSEPVKTSQEILKALEKLAAQPQELRLSSVPTEIPIEPQTKQMRKELPVFDAFDIDNFFDALKMPDAQSKASPKLEALPLKKEIKVELPEESISAENIPNFAALKEEQPCMSPPYFVPASVDRPQPQAPSMFLSSAISETYYEPADRVSFNPDISANENQHPPLTKSSKDLVLVPQPKFMSSQEKIDDLLSYFSDDGSDVSSLHTDSSSFYLDRSATQDFLDDTFYQKSYHMDQYNSYQRQMDHQLSPLSSSSSLSGEDDIALEEDHSTDMLETALGENPSTNSFKDGDVLCMHDEFKLDFSDFFPASEGSLDLIKNGQ
ncbi:Neuronal PAS domain-containing protein 4 [Biomphalaria glabrata]